VGPIIQRNKAIAKRKGTLAVAAAGGSVALLIVSAPILGILGLAGTAYLGYDWFQFRVKNGMRL
jgi:threonine/homoserine/homoserine lactone efflux protein